MKIAVLGAGNLGKSIVAGLLENKFNASEITVTRNKIELLEDLKSNGVVVTRDNKVAVQNSEIILLAVKPYRAAEILKEIAPYLTSNKILISVVSDFFYKRYRGEFECNSNYC